MKQIFTATLLLTICLTTLADSFEFGGLSYEPIPEADNNVTVVGGNGTFMGTAIDIPDSVEYNGVQYKVSSISQRAFMGAPVLTTVNVPFIEQIGRQAFADCPSLQSVAFGSGLNTIDDGAFSRCVALTRLDIPSTLTDLGDYVFDGCTSLQEVEFNEVQMDEIPPFTFRNCVTLSSISWPAGIKVIGNHAFENCDLSRLRFPATLRTISEYAFTGCSGMERIYITGDQMEIMDGAFSYCSVLDSVQFANVQRIGSGAFAHCDTLRQVTFYPGLDFIGTTAFAGCGNLSVVDCLTDLPPVIYPSTFDAVTNRKAMLRVPKDCINLYKQTSLWDRFIDIQPEGTNVGVDVTDIDRYQVSVVGDYLNIDSDDANVTVYSAAGDVIYTSSGSVGNHRVLLPSRGLYLVRLNGRIVKVVY